MKEVSELFKKEVEHARYDANDGLITMGAIGTGGAALSYFIGYGMPQAIGNVYSHNGIVDATMAGLTLGVAAAAFTYVVANKSVFNLVAFGQVVKEKLQENKLDFSLGISDKIKDDELASKICKILREVSEDKEKFAKFVDMIELSKDDSQKIRDLIDKGEAEIKAQNIAKGKKDYSEEFSILYS